jgi:hypothetical protein
LIARLIASMPTGLNSMSGGRLEERLDAVVAPIGPFITVGAPDEPLPKLGAARVYLVVWHGISVTYSSCGQAASAGSALS